MFIYSFLSKYHNVLSLDPVLHVCLLDTCEYMAFLRLCTLLCWIIMLDVLLIFNIFPYLHGLLWTTRLFILLKNSYQHVYLEQNVFILGWKLSISAFVDLKMTTTWQIDMPVTFPYYLLQCLTFWWHRNWYFLTYTFIRYWEIFLPTRLLGTAGLLYLG